VAAADSLRGGEAYHEDLPDESRCMKPLPGCSESTCASYSGLGVAAGSRQQDGPDFLRRIYVAQQDFWRDAQQGMDFGNVMGQGFIVPAMRYMTRQIDGKLDGADPGMVGLGFIEQADQELGQVPGTDQAELKLPCRDSENLALCRRTA